MNFHVSTFITLIVLLLGSKMNVPVPSVRLTLYSLNYIDSH